jgi:hypothetical protein
LENQQSGFDMIMGREFRVLKFHLVCQAASCL